MEKQDEIAQLQNMLYEKFSAQLQQEMEEILSVRHSFPPHTVPIANPV